MSRSTPSLRTEKDVTSVHACCGKAVDIQDRIAKRPRLRVAAEKEIPDLVSEALGLVLRAEGIGASRTAHGDRHGFALRLALLDLVRHEAAVEEIAPVEFRVVLVVARSSKVDDGEISLALDGRFLRPAQRELQEAERTK